MNERAVRAPERSFMPTRALIPTAASAMRTYSPTRVADSLMGSDPSRAVTARSFVVSPTTFATSPSVSAISSSESTISPSVSIISPSVSEGAPT